ncbi:uncharacterized protein F5147DRAFT_775389 [Suillus discolor]|uniref:Uncharacterized protein n=1 Tax=Suillus discolor TaxID=1912936 RepID=A0A9P7JSH2_9AGAM|nr:uncharacterized protein F5147DRAFT_775389 [Suillus discolor]KAG2105067.1 hypothetical protein F5147DRAFT_775389 [Suillus discolor]
MTPQSESSVGNDFGAASSDASLTPGVQLTSDSHFTSFNNHDLSGTDTSAFDYNMFTTVINDPSFDIWILDFPPLNACHDTSAHPGVFLPPVPPVTSLTNVGGSGMQNEAPYPEVFLPPIPPATSLPNVGGSGTPHPEVFLPPVPPVTSLPNVGGSGTQNEALYPEVFLPPVPPVTSFPDIGGSGTQNNAPTLPVEARTMPRRGRRLQQPMAPTSSVDPFDPLPEGRRRARKPFNAQECDNEIGGPTK